jgi:anti-anti-sigma factor
MATPVETVRALWDAYREGGLEALLELTGDAVVWQPYGAAGRVLHGSAELRAALDQLAAAGIRWEPRLYDLEAHEGDAVLVHGALTIHRPDGAEEVDVHWLLHFREGRLSRQTSYLTREDALGALTGLRLIAAPPFLIGEHGGAAGESVMHVHGELDVATAPRLEEALVRPRADGERLVLDFADLRFMDSTGLRALLRGRRAADEGGWELCLRHVPDQVQRLFELAGVRDIVPRQVP